MASEQLELPHKLTLNQRKELTMTGVMEVVSFDENLVVLRCSLGDLLVHGQQLQLKTLSTDGGQVAVVGQVQALIYEQPRTGGWLRRLFG